MSKVKKILILTVHPMNPPHPRIGKEIYVIEKAGYKIEYLSLKDDVLKSTMSNRFFRGLFQNPFFKKRVLKKIENYLEYDYFLFYDLHLLNVAFKFKKMHPLKKVVYETIDDNLSLYLYYNFKKLSNYVAFESKVLKCLRDFELKKAFSLDATIVNSKGLQEIFDNKSNLLYYTSIFEGHILNQNASKPNALLYLGGFDEGKGAFETISLSSKYKVPLFVFGNTSDTIKNKMLNYKHIKYFGYMNSKEMLKELQILVQDYFLFGVSLIKPIHHSYMIQIANKEIDYVSLGIPILGNDREPTRELIDEGCGICYDDFNNHINIDTKEKLSTRCLEYTKKAFSSNIYEDNLLKVFNAL